MFLPGDIAGKLPVGDQRSSGIFYLIREIRTKKYVVSPRNCRSDVTGKLQANTKITKL